MRVSEHFLRSEFKCPCCDFAAVDAALLAVLEKTRAHFGDNPIKINSGNRCQAHNRQVGGAEKSQHVNGMAADFVVKNTSADDVASYLESEYENWFGVGRYTGRTHIDVRSTPARWDRRGL